MGRPGQYLYKRKGSQHWWIKFRYTGTLREKLGPFKEQSLGTPDRDEAELKALPLIHAHKFMLFTERAMNRGDLAVTRNERQFEPGEHYVDEGRVIATPDQLIYLDHDGKLLRTEPNQPTYGISIPVADAEHREWAKRRVKDNPDDAILEAYLTERGVNERDAADARKVWEEFKRLANAKPLSKCTQDEGRKLVDLLQEQVSGKTGKKLTTATIGKKLNYMSAAVNYAMKQRRFKGANPFLNLTVKGREGVDRIPLSNADMSKMREALDPLSEEYRLWVTLACTGMRVSEAFALEEFEEEGLRYIIPGLIRSQSVKTDQSKRRVPIPDAVAKLIPVFDGKQFSNTPHNLGRNLVRRMRRVGITDPRKVVHSLRHRAKDQLRIVQCPLDVQYQILGHEEDTVAAGYGRGYPVRILKEWVERIQF